MKAVRIHSFGSSAKLQLEDIAKPIPQAGEVLIRVQAASVNPVDYKIRAGEFKPNELKMPLTLGRDVSGVVEQVGPGVSEVDVGEAVYALLDQEHGGYADFVVTKIDGVAPKPGSLDHIHAAAVPLAALTAWQGLFDHGLLKAGELVLIHGAAGGVGHFAVQFAKSRGAKVIVTAAAEDRDMLLELGADEVIDYKHEAFDEKIRGVDLVLDLVAGDMQQRSWKCLKRGGRLISTLQHPSKTKALFHHVKAEVYLTKPDRNQLAAISRLIDEGQVKVIVKRTLPLAEARLAHDYMEHEHVSGKVVLSVGALAA
jgi:NADPH:quinone reductase-like Zn-dependent oxidoreductase